MRTATLDSHLFDLGDPLRVHLFASKESEVIAELLTRHGDGVRYRLVDWETFNTEHPRVLGRVYVVDATERRESYGRLTGLAASSPLTITLVAVREMKLLCGLPEDGRVDRIVLLNDPEADVHYVVRAALRRSLIEVVPSAIGCLHEHPLDPVVVDAIRVICSPPPIPTTITRVMSELGWAPSTLARHWKWSLPSSALRPIEFLNAVLLTRARESFNPCEGWDPPAAYLRLHRRTLERIARRLTNRTLTELTAVRPLTLTRGIVRAVRDPATWGSTGEGAVSA